MPIANFKPVASLYEFKMQEYQNDILSDNIQIEEDRVLLEEYKNQKSETLNIGAMVKEELMKTINELQNTKNELEKELDAFAGVLWDEFVSHASQSPEEIFNQIFEPFLQALTPLMEVVSSVGLPEVPIIGNIQNIIQKIAKTGQLIAKLPKEVRDAARKEAEAKKKVEQELRKAEADAATAERKLKQENQNMSWWERQKDDFKNSPIGKVILEIVEIFKQVLQIITMICQCALYAAILMILEKLKPIIGMLGDVVALVTNAYTVLKMLMFSQAQMLKFFYKMLEEKLSELYGIVTYVIDGGWSLPVNFMISAIYADMLCCEYDISSINFEMSKLSLEHYISDKKEELEDLNSNKSKVEASLENARGDELNGTYPQYMIDNLNTQLSIYENSINSTETIINDSESNLKTILENQQFFTNNRAKKYRLELDKLTSEDNYLSAEPEASMKLMEEQKQQTEKLKKEAEENRKKLKEVQDKKAANATKT